MINKHTLTKIVDVVQRGDRLLPGEVAILREAVDLLDDLASTLDKIMPGADHARGFDHETTQQLKIIRDDDQWGRP